MSRRPRTTTALVPGLIAALTVGCDARGPAADAALTDAVLQDAVLNDAVLNDAAPNDAVLNDADTALCPPERASSAVDLNAYPDGAGFRYVGDTAAASNSTATLCGGETSPDVLHRFVAPSAGFWRFDTEATLPKWDTVLTLRGRCDDGAALACNDDAAFPPLSQVSASLAAGQVVFVIVDGRASGVAPERGAYILTASPR